MKKALKNLWWLPLWVFAAAFLISGSISILSLRHNNQTMINLRNQLYAVDKNNGDVNTALNNLKNYVVGHMNTDLSSGGNTIKPPIQLKYTYQRLVQSQEQQLTDQNSQLYTQAQSYCQAQDPTDFFGYYRVPCVEQYLRSHGLQDAIINVPEQLYKFDFVSPSWSPYLAGWSLLLSSISLAFLAAKLIGWRWTK